MNLDVKGFLNAISDTYGRLQSVNRIVQDLENGVQPNPKDLEELDIRLPF